MKKITNIEELMNTLEGSGYFGLRGASKHDIKVAKRGYLDCSLDLWDSRDCDYDEDAKVLNGTSAIGVNEYMDKSHIVKLYKEAKGYANNHHDTDVVYLLNDKRQEQGYDENEVVLGSNGYGADVVAIVEL